MANEEHLARLKHGVAAWNQQWKGRSSVLRQRCASAFQKAWGFATLAGRQGLQTIKKAGRKTVTQLRAMPWQINVSRHWKLLLLIVAAIIGY
jgi:hypothetical protein